ncbi:hypothetical protein FRB96_006810 [Tulasnella sp. 330]|nr:hypothetical protein FRB96_006810 [Tulasnella sp. 330]KAG8878962.1 hypothetical protein FRB97_002058 [Tulasnella sp. 331]KAG8882775.1 hypothetical protein FRB98_003489 [Tulasnella sp. 332]
MAAKKKKTTAADGAIPLARPPQYSTSENAVDDIPDDEKLRLLSQSGLLSKIPQKEPVTEAALDFLDELFFTATYAIPMTFLYFCMDVLIHHQYAQQLPFREEAIKVATNVPFLSVFIFYSNRHKTSRLVQLALFMMSVVCGTRLIWTLNKEGWRTAMQEAAPLTTLWTYTVMQLDLIPCGVSVATVFGIVKFLGLRLQL